MQHRTGNALEQITKFLGTLGGVFCVSKVMNKSHLIKALRERVHAALEATLVIHQQQPAALQEEWREAKAHLRSLVDLANSFQEAGDVANQAGAVQGSNAAAWDACLAFFDGPITGQGAWGICFSYAAIF